MNDIGDIHRVPPLRKKPPPKITDDDFL